MRSTMNGKMVTAAAIAGNMRKMIGLRADLVCGLAAFWYIRMHEISTDRPNRTRKQWNAEIRMNFSANILYEGKHSASQIDIGMTQMKSMATGLHTRAEGNRIPR